MEISFKLNYRTSILVQENTLREKLEKKIKKAQEDIDLLTSEQEETLLAISKALAKTRPSVDQLEHFLNQINAIILDTREQLDFCILLGLNGGGGGGGEEPDEEKGDYDISKPKSFRVLCRLVKVDGFNTDNFVELLEYILNNTGRSPKGRVGRHFFKVEGAHLDKQAYLLTEEFIGGDAQLIHRPDIGHNAYSTLGSGTKSVFRNMLARIKRTKA